jgi:PAS domain S-box-containing protein
LVKQATTQRTAKQPRNVPVGPLGLVGRPWEYPVASAFALALVLIFVAELATPREVVVTMLALIPIVAAAWLLSTPLALGVAVVGFGLVGVAGGTGAIAPVTAVAEASVFAVLAIAIRLYARSLVILLRGTLEEATPGSAMLFGLENLAKLVDSATLGVAALNQAGRIIYANSAVGGVLGLSPESLIGTDFVTYIVPEDRPQVGSYFADITVGRAGQLAVRATRPDGDVRELAVTQTMTVARGRPVGVVSVRDVTEVNRLQRATTALTQVATNMAVTQPIERMLEAVARSVVEATDAVAAGVFLLEGQRSLRTAGICNLPAGYALAIDAAVEAGPARPALEAITKQVDVLDEDLPSRILSDPAFASAHSVVRDVPWKLVVAIPMIHGDRSLGALCAYFPPEQRPSEPTMTFLHAIAGLAASAAEIFRLVSIFQRQVTLEERQRLARELHDSVSQALYGIALGATSARNRLTRGLPRAVEPLDYILGLAEAALADMRSLILELQPEFEREGLVGALTKRVEAIRIRYNIAVSADLPDEPSIPLDTKQTVYRIAQEALHNVVKHSRAKHASLRLRIDVEAVIMEVSDDGEGFDVSWSYPDHFGLQSMRERAESRGGEFLIESRPGAGVTVRVSVPIAAVQSAPGVVVSTRELASTRT